MELHQAVAGNIHRIRKSQRLSMDRAAELAGISVSMWGQVERGSVNPTLAVLGKIASGLHVPLELLIENREEAPATLYRAVDVAGQRLYGGKVIRYPLFPFDTDSRSESCQMDIFISGAYEAADHVPGSHVYLTVLSGTVKVTCGGEVFRLESRDCLSLLTKRQAALYIRLPGQAERQYVNVGNTTVRLLEWIVYRKNG